MKTCYFSTLVSALFDDKEYVAEQAFVSRLKPYLLFEYFCYKDRIKLSNDIMSDHVRNKGEQRICYKIPQWG